MQHDIMNHCGIMNRKSTPKPPYNTLYNNTNADNPKPPLREIN